ncbi:hypothetical protein VPH35_074396 [Triticum aestivum]
MTSGVHCDRQTKSTMEESAPASLMREFEPFTAPSLEELLPQLSSEEQGRLRRDTAIMRHVRHHYNARHPGDEYDAVKPLMASTATFKEQLWAHVNFWARSRKSSRVKRFFAEVRYKHGNAAVEVCVIIEEPLGRHRKSCAFCPGSWDILHPAGGSRKFVLGNDKDRMVQRIQRPKFSSYIGMPFTCRPGPDSPRVPRHVGRI